MFYRKLILPFLLLNVVQKKTGTLTVSSSPIIETNDLKDANVYLSNSTINYIDGGTCITNYFNQVMDLIVVKYKNKTLRKDIDYEIPNGTRSISPKRIDLLCNKKDISMCIDFVIYGKGDYYGYKRINGINHNVSDDTYCVIIK